METLAALGVLGVVLLVAIVLYGKAQASKGSAKARSKVAEKSAKAQKRFKDAKRKSAASTARERLDRMRRRARDR